MGGLLLLVIFPAPDIIMDDWFFSREGFRQLLFVVIYPALKVFTGKGFAWCFNRCYRGGQKSEVRN